MSGSSICYLNTDLELASPDDLSALAAALEAQAVVPLHLTRQADGLSYAAFKTAEQHDEPEPNIAAMLAVVETLAEPLRAVWAGCVRRESTSVTTAGAGLRRSSTGCRATCRRESRRRARRFGSRSTRRNGRGGPTERLGARRRRAPERPPEALNRRHTTRTDHIWKRP